MDEIILDMLQYTRDQIQRPININSGHRCAKHNQEVGGREESRHLTGYAVDVRTQGLEDNEKQELLHIILEFVKDVEWQSKFGIGVYPTFIHVDRRDQAAFWVGE
jgi:uncharacterized protein YcbK (DUF882 family)